MTSSIDAAAADQQQPDQATVAALTLVLLSGLPSAALGAYLAQLLAPYGLSVELARALAALIEPRLGPPLVAGRAATGVVAQAYTAATQAVHTAAYTLQAARRLAAGGTLDRERLHLQQHLAARSARSEAARQVDAAAAAFGPVVGWHAVLDAHTTPECRAAHGHNFHVAGPPAVGYPGTLHGGTCRCKAGPPFEGASGVDDATGFGRTMAT